MSNFNERKNRYQLIEGKWKLIDTTIEVVSQEVKERSTSQKTAKFIASLSGSTETVRTNGYTSVSPDGLQKIVATYKEVTR